MKLIYNAGNKRNSISRETAESFGYPKNIELSPLEQISLNYAIDIFSQGYDLHKEGDFEGALKSYTDALKINPRLSYAHNNMGEILGGFGYPEDALKSYTDALKINPGLSKTHNSIRRLLREFPHLKSKVRGISIAE